MLATPSYRIIASVLGVVLGLCSAAANAIEIDVIWIGGGGNNLWSNRNNWDCTCVPCNQGPVEFNVTIPGGVGTVQYDVAAGNCSIKRLTLGNNSTLAVASGVTLTVLEDADICGVVDALDDLMAAHPSLVSASCGRTRAYASNGATVRISAPSFSTELLWIDSCGVQNIPVIRASGPASFMDLSSVLSIDGGYNDNPNPCVVTVQQIVASLGGAVDLSGAQTLTGPFKIEDRIDIVVTDNTSSMNLSSLETITSTNMGQAGFVLSGDVSVDLSSLQTITSPGLRGKTRFQLSNGATLSLPSLQTAEQVTMDVSGGASLHSAGSQPVLYATTGLWIDSCGTQTVPLLTATGPASVLDLTAIQTLNAGYSDNANPCVVTVQQVQATARGVIDLSGVQILTAPAKFEDRIDFIVTDDGSGLTSLNLSSLETITSTNMGQTGFVLSGDVSVDLSSLQTITSPGLRGKTRFQLSNGATLSLPSLQTVEQVTLSVSGGASLHAAGSQQAVYDTTGLWIDSCGTQLVPVLTATGAASILNLPSVRTFDAGFSDNPDPCVATVQQIIASDNGAINLSGTASLICPVKVEDRFELIANTGGLIDVSSLEAISGGPGRLNVVLNTGGELRTGPWNEVTELVTIDLTNAGAPTDPTTTLHAFGNLTATTAATVSIDLLHANTRLDVDGSLVTGDNIDIIAPSGGTISVGGHFFFTHTVENELMLGDAIVRLDGSGTDQAPQVLEVGGLDVDVICSLLSNDNFGFGQLVVGNDGQPTVVELHDDISNGNSGGGNREALYLFGLGPSRCDGAQNSLRLLGGSTLVIPASINAYAYVFEDELGHSDEFVHLNALLEVDGDPLPYDEGFIQLVSAGGYEFPAAGAANRVAVGDRDGDLDPDVIIVIPGEDSVQVFLNQGTDGDGLWQGLSGLAPVLVGPQPSAVALGLFNDDPHLDAVVTNAGDDTITVLFNDGSGNGTFGSTDSYPSGNNPSAVVTADFSVDGSVDFAVANKDDNNIDLFTNDGTGQFVPGTPISSGGLAPLAVDPSDVDGDRDPPFPDLVGVNEVAAGKGVSGSVFVSLNGRGGFGPPVTHQIGVAPTDLAVGDLNHDGLLDIVTANGGDDTLSILVNQGDGLFAPGTELPVGQSPLSVVAVDLDGDGDLDLAVVATPVIPAVQVIENLGVKAGDLVFSAPVALGVDADPNFLADADFDDDGLHDLVTVNDDQGPTGGSVTVLLTLPPCPWDINGDGVITNISDLLLLLAQWGACPAPPGECPADFDGDGIVGIADLLALLVHWGACP